MAANLTTITNISKQLVPILVNSITSSSAQTGSDLDAARSEQTFIQPGAEINIETNRIDLAQLEQMRRNGLIRFVSR